MSKYLVKRAERNRARPVRKIESDAVDVLAPTTCSSPFLSFRYSYTEMSVLGGKAHVKSRNARFEDGKLTSETFEGGRLALGDVYAERAAVGARGPLAIEEPSRPGDLRHDELSTA